MQKILTILHTTNFKKQHGRNDIVSEFEHMTNWQRNFEHIWMQIRWLNSYGHMNKVALTKILKKFVKNFFENKETPIKKKLSNIVTSKNFEPVEG